MQVLSCASAGVLVAVCGLLLRSQSLVSGARSPNFEISDPGSESNGVSQELIPIIVILIGLVSTPALIAISLAIHANSKFKKAALAIEHRANEAALTMKRASISVLGQEDNFQSQVHIGQIESKGIQSKQSLSAAEESSAVTGPSSNLLGQEDNSQSQVHIGQIESKGIQSKQSLSAAEESSAATGPLRLPDLLLDEEGDDNLAYGAAEKPISTQVSEPTKKMEASQLINSLLRFKRTNLREIPMPLSFSHATLPFAADSIGGAVPSRLADETSLNRNTGYSFNSNFKGSASTQRFQQPRALSSPILADPSDILSGDESPSHSLSFRQEQLPAITQQRDKVIVAEVFSPPVRTLPQQSRREYLANSAANPSDLSQHPSPSINANASSAGAVRQSLYIPIPAASRSSSRTSGSSDSIGRSSDRAAADSSIMSSQPSGRSLARRLDQI
jgi:hypothetical protein